ncbi:MAG: zinc-dependent metalloprotease [Candidatus Dormibacteria bacterium]
MPRSHDGHTLRRSLAVGAGGGAAFLSLRALLRPRNPEMGEIVDWAGAREIAVDRSGERGAGPLATVAAGRGADYDALAAELAPLMAEVCQSTPQSFPPFTVVDRRGFIDNNLQLAQRLFEPVERIRAGLPESRATVLGRVAMTRYVGEMFGMVSRRVLGQYDPVLPVSPPAGGDAPSPALYLVEPNVRGFERSHDAPGLPLRRWLILHELTHAWQFESHPWLRLHLAGLLREMIATGLEPLSGGAPRPSPMDLLGRLPQALRGQLAMVGRLQAVMSVLEGYSNFVMHRVGRRHIEPFDVLEQAFHRRRQERSGLERLISTLTGMNMKLRQYELGERFADVVSTRGGLDLLNTVWEAPERMPTMEELRRPELWLSRAAG